MTTSLLQRILGTSIVFEHDPGELDIWLSALPKFPPEADLASRATLLTQQIYLLSFVDDAFRRTTRTPYRYLEESMSLVPDHFSPAKPYEMISPVLMTMLEQLKAKLLGELLSTDAAGVVMGWLRRVILGMSGKMRNVIFLEAVTACVEATLEEAKMRGQSRGGLKGVLEGMKEDLKRVFGPLDEIRLAQEGPWRSRFDLVARDSPIRRRGQRFEADRRAVRVFLDDHCRSRPPCRVWAQSSFERTMLKIEDIEQSWTAIQALIASASDSSLSRMGGFTVHLLRSPSTTERKRLSLKVIERCLGKISSKILADRFKAIVFDAPEVQKLFNGSPGDDHRNRKSDRVPALIVVADHRRRSREHRSPLARG